MNTVLILSLLIGSSLLAMEEQERALYDVSSVSWINDTTIAAASWDGTTTIWDIQSPPMPRIKHTLNTGDPMVHAASYNKTNNLLATASRTIKLWDASDGQLVASFGESTTSISWNHTGTELASSSTSENKVIIWSITVIDGKVHSEIIDTFENLKDKVQRVSWSPDGKYLAIGFDKNSHAVEIWDTTVKPYKKYQERIANLARRVVDLSWSPDSMNFAVVWNKENTDTSASVVIYSIQTGNNNRTLAHDKTVYAVAHGEANTYTNWTTYITTGSQDQKVYIWKLTAIPINVALTGHTGWVKCVAYNQYYTKVATGSADGTVRIWAVKTGELLLKLDKSA